MKIEKAVEVLKRSEKRYPNILDLETQDAIKLGIEALKAIKEDRVLHFATSLHPLPGETND